METFKNTHVLSKNLNSKMASKTDGKNMEYYISIVLIMVESQNKINRGVGG